MSRGGALLCAGAFVAGAWWVRQPFAPPGAAVGIAAFVAAGAYLVRSPHPRYATALAGLLAGIWTGVLEFQGLPAAAAIVIAGALPLTSAWLRAHRAAFAPPALRDEALLFTIVLGLFVAAAPEIVAGWHAAIALNLQSVEPAAAGAAIPVWAVTATTAALISGGLFSLWSRR